MATSDIGSIPQQVKRAKAEGVQISECAIRRLIKEGKIPARYIGPKALFSYSALMRYLNCEDGADNTPATVAANGIRRCEV